MVAALRAAAVYWDGQRSDFAAGKGDTCRDMADKLDRFGSFVSEKQAGYAAKLVEWAKPRQPVYVPVPAPVAQPVAPVISSPVTALPKLFALMQRLSKLVIGKVTIARKNGDSLCWIKLDGIEGVVGKIEGGVLTTFNARLTFRQLGDVLADLLNIEVDPEAAAVKHGKASGRCSVCSRDLTDPESIERGIGPICAGKFQS
jgi:hypothetical protein